VGGLYRPPPTYHHTWLRGSSVIGGGHLSRFMEVTSPSSPLPFSVVGEDGGAVILQISPLNLQEVRPLCCECLIRSAVSILACPNIIIRSALSITALSFSPSIFTSLRSILNKIIVLTETKLHSLIFNFERKFEQKF